MFGKLILNCIDLCWDGGGYLQTPTNKLKQTTGLDTIRAD